MFYGTYEIMGFFGMLGSDKIFYLFWKYSTNISIVHFESTYLHLNKL